ncbi:MAG: hypothetical protein KC731_18140, partial [Myxococcales bacterium]|nr:hypothetical protein [Myxococcales bacterium]
RSFDGLHWEEDLHPVTNCEGESYPPSCKNWMGGVAYGDGLWLAGGGNGALMRSVDDGVTWTGLHPSPGLSAVRSIAFGGGVFVAGTDGGVLSVSSDGGDSWTHHDLWDYDFQVAAGGGAFVAQGRHWNGSGFDYGCAVSVDAGASWSSCDPALLTAGPAAYGDGRWVAQTSGGYLESSDATTWTMVSAMDFPDQPVWTGEGWIGIRGGNAVTSQNLVDWQVGAGNVPGFRAITGGLVLDDNLPVENVPLCQDNG